MNPVAEYMDVDVSFTTENPGNLTDDKEKVLPDQEIRQWPAQNDDKCEGTSVTETDVPRREDEEETCKTPSQLQDVPTLEKDENVYSSMGIAEGKQKNTKKLRLNALHMRGTEDMSTKDVFSYFEGSEPVSIEWVNDVSCNVVWHDNISAARALLKFSKKHDGLADEVVVEKHIKTGVTSFVNGNASLREGSCDEEETNNETYHDNVISPKAINCPLPPGIWRKGVDHPKSKAIFMRFSTIDDKKQPRAEKMSNYYKKYGNPNYGGMRGLLTESRKRMYREAYHSKQQSREETTERAAKKPCKNPWGTLSQTWGQNDATEDDCFRPQLIPRRTNSDVKERLGLKSSMKKASLPAIPSEDDESNIRSNGEKSDDEWCRRSKVLRMRMHADDEEKKLLQKRFLKKTAHHMEPDSTDLRSRLDSTKKNPAYCSPIQVVVTNDTEEFLRRYPDVHQGEDSNAIEIGTDPNEQEEGEWTDEVEEVDKQSEDEENEDSDVSEKEIQGPKGSVIKVVPRVKPRVASTVWSRLNNTMSGAETNDRSASGRNSRGNVKGDLRSRLGYHNRNRSPLRIEVKNEKYAEDSSDTE